ncbi:MAG: response regulator [Acetobacteraceae bacterium]|nr:response regulator [Acetobacteraceae bacterium]
MSFSQPARILLVDDDEGVRGVTAAIIEDLGYSVLEAGSGQAALDAMERGAGVDLVMVDFAMPRMNGAEFARRAHELRPGLPILIVTGYADARALEAVGQDRIVLKPFRNEDLARRIRTALGAGENGQVVSLRR